MRTSVVEYITEFGHDGIDLWRFFMRPDDRTEIKEISQTDSIHAFTHCPIAYSVTGAMEMMWPMKYMSD